VLMRYSCWTTTLHPPASNAAVQRQPICTSFLLSSPRC
jgi:hypothetical protein